MKSTNLLARRALMWWKRKEIVTPEELAKQEADKIEQELEAARIAREEQLRQACHARAVALIVFPGLDALHHKVTFHSTTQETLSFRMGSEPSETPFLPLTLCLVHYNAGSRSYTFVTNVQRHEHDSSPNLLQVDLPKNILEAESAKAFRIPISASVEISAKVRRGDGEPLTPSVVDLSLTGLQFAFASKEKTPELALGEEVTVELQMDSVRVSLEGHVRRRVRRGYGVYFPGVLKDNTIQPPDELRQIIVNLERLWLQQRSND